mgnify:CR=1 FL=1
MLYYLNNWRNRAHARIYGGLAISDLWADGTEDKRVRAMSAGDACWIIVVPQAGVSRLGSISLRGLSAALTT